MPSITDRRSVRASALILVGAGSEPSGELTAPPPGILDEVPDEMRRKLPDELIDELLAGARTEEELVGPGGVLAGLTKRLVERAMEVELTDHLGYEPTARPPGGAGNTRNGSTPKTLDHRARAGGDRDAERSRRDLRAADRQEASAAV